MHVGMFCLLLLSISIVNNVLELLHVGANSDFVFAYFE